MLSESLIEIGTIKIIYDDHMIALNQAFVPFIEGLEQRVLSYKDFMDYRKGYYEEWMKQVSRIFQ